MMVLLGYFFIAAIAGVAASGIVGFVLRADREEFADPEEATARGLLFVKKWLEENTPESP